MVIYDTYLSAPVGEFHNMKMGSQITVFIVELVKQIGEFVLIFVFILQLAGNCLELL